MKNKRKYEKIFLENGIPYSVIRKTEDINNLRSWRQGIGHGLQIRVSAVISNCRASKKQITKQITTK